MKYAILINSNPDTSLQALTAFRFVKTALEMGHEVVRVFFYKEGIYHALADRLPPEDELNLTGQWQSLARENNLDLAVCVSAAQRRGLLNTEEARRQNKPSNLAAGFRIAGLGQLVEAMLEADRFLEF